MTGHCLIIGASHAAAQACVSLRQGGWDGDITVVGDEPNLPYHRPPLSKDFLSGQKDIEDILIRPESAYETANIDLKLGTRISAIDPKAKTATTESDEIINFTKLILNHSNTQTMIFRQNSIKKSGFATARGTNEGDTFALFYG